MRVGRRPVLLARPTVHQYGHQAIDILLALAYARLVNLPVVFIRPGVVASEALFEVESDEVRISRSRSTRLLLRISAAIADRAKSTRAWRTRVTDQIRQEKLHELARYREGHPTLSRPIASKLREVRRGIKSKSRSKPMAKQLITDDRRPYWRRRLLAEPVATRLTARAEQQALEVGARLGIGPDTKLVTVHARERGYKLGNEMQDKSRSKSRMDDSVRNGRIESHFDAIDFLVDRGYTVVRMGDPSMTPVERQGLVDLATSPARDAYLELYCLWRSRFLISGESGPLAVAYLTNTPFLTVNATDPISAFPVRADGICLLKTVLDRATGQALSLPAFLSADYLTNLRDTVRFAYVENTGDQILEAVKEMLDLLDGDRHESAGQAKYRELVARTAEAMRDNRYIRKWGADEGFMGHGRIARSLAESWPETEDDALASASAAASG